MKLPCSQAILSKSICFEQGQLQELLVLMQVLVRLLLA
jgi:hypothetical protein